MRGPRAESADSVVLGSQSIDTNVHQQRHWKAQKRTALAGVNPATSPAASVRFNQIVHFDTAGYHEVENRTVRDSHSTVVSRYQGNSMCPMSIQLLDAGHLASTSRWSPSQDPPGLHQGDHTSATLCLQLINDRLPARSHCPDICNFVSPTQLKGTTPKATSSVGKGISSPRQRYHRSSGRYAVSLASLSTS